MAAAENISPTVIVLGPAKPPVHMIQNIHARKIYLKSSSMKALVELYQSLDKSAYSSSLFFTPNPVVISFC